MADIKWIKITTDVFDDDKILLIESLPDADSIIVIWFKLLCLAGKQNNSGVFIMGNKIPYTEKMLSTIFRRKESTVKLALQTFEQFGMIERINDVITLPNWEKHQSLDKLESAKEKTRSRVAKYREKQKALTMGNEDVTQCNVTVTLPVTQCNAVEKNRIEEDKKEMRIEREEGVTPTPTLADITNYIICNNLSINPNRFFSYYDERGWKTGNGKPIQWQQKLQEWDFDDKQKAKSNAKPETNSNPFLALAKEENLF